MSPVVLDGDFLVGAVSPASFTFRCVACGFNAKQPAFKDEAGAKKGFEAHLRKVHGDTRAHGYFESPLPWEPLREREPAAT